MRKIIEQIVNLDDLLLNELFDLSDVEITNGGFSCAHNNLTSLKGAPLKCKSIVRASYNNLTSLEGIPKIIGGSFYIDKALKDKFPEEYIRSLSKIRGNVFYH